MTYEEIVDEVRTAYENADARHIFEHIAVQINIVGEGEGIMYIEIADRKICVEPYDYYDHDALVTVDAQTIHELVLGKLSFHDAYHSGRLNIKGNFEKIKKVSDIKYKVLKTKAKKVK